MSDSFYNLYKTASQKTLDFASIIGGYTGLLNIAISELQSDFPLYTKEQLIEKLKLHHEILQENFKEANK